MTHACQLTAIVGGYAAECSCKHWWMIVVGPDTEAAIAAARRDIRRAHRQHRTEEPRSIRRRNP